MTNALRKPSAPASVTGIKPTSIDDLVERYQQRLMQYFTRRARCQWDAEELTQEVFCKIIKRQDVSNVEYTASYIFTIAKSVLYDSFRRDRVRQRDQHVAYDETFETKDSVTPANVHGGSELYIQFLRGLDTLTPRCREVFLLSRYGHMSYPQIAEHLGVCVSAVEKHIIVALRRLRHAMDVSN